MNWQVTTFVFNLIHLGLVLALFLTVSAGFRKMVTGFNEAIKGLNVISEELNDLRKKREES